MDNKTNNCDYGKLYDSNYYDSHLGDISYGDEFWRKGFEYIADKIVEQFNPKTVLDVGCAFGYLVTALRDRGVEAYGIDISEYAINKVRDDIKPYCRVCSATGKLPREFPEKYDLVTTIEMIEHLYPEDGEIVIRNLCKYSDSIVFSSSPDDEEEETHFNVQPAKYWVGKFYENGFFNDYNKKPSYISPQCLYFHKTLNIEKVINDYELAIEMLNKNHRDEINLVAKDREKAQEVMDNEALELQQLKERINVIKVDREKAQEVMDNQALELQQLKERIDVIKVDREKAQEVMDNQALELQQLKERIDVIKVDREKAQEVMDSQALELQLLKERIDVIKVDREKAQEVIDNQAQKIEKLKIDISDKEKQYQEVVQSIFWRATKPIKFICDKLKGK